MTSDKKTPPRRKDAGATPRKPSGSAQSSATSKKSRGDVRARPKPTTPETKAGLSAETVFDTATRVLNWVSEEENWPLVEKAAAAVTRLAGKMPLRALKTPPAHTNGHTTDPCIMAALLGKQIGIQDRPRHGNGGSEGQGKQQVEMQARSLLADVLGHLTDEDQQKIVDSFAAGYQEGIEAARPGQGDPYTE